MLPTPFALEKGTLRSLRDLNTRVGLEVVRNTQPPRGAQQLAQHLAHAYPVRVPTTAPPSLLGFV